MSGCGVPPTLTLAPHLAPDALKARHLESQAPAERTRWQGLWLVAVGKKGVEVAELLGRSPAWVSVLVRDYGRRGPCAVPLVQRQGQQWGGSPTSLDAAGLVALTQALSGPPRRAACGPGPKCPCGSRHTPAG